MSRACAWRFRIGRPNFASFREAGTPMRQTLYKRLQQVEEVARARQQRERSDKGADTGKFLKKISWFLRVRVVEKQGHESLVEALCRALEIDGMELRRQLAARIDPINKYLIDNGLYEEIQKELQKKKAAGTIPGG